VNQEAKLEGAEGTSAGKQVQKSAVNGSISLGSTQGFPPGIDQLRALCRQARSLLFAL
jgi:hypothetical protein